MKRKIITLLSLTVLFAVGFLLMRYLQAVLPFSLGVDLIPRWVGTQALLEGVSPYSLEARQRTWQVIYGANEPQGNVFGFYYPPAITTLLMPFVLAHVPISIATAGWSALVWSAWLAALLISSREKTRLPFALLLISGIFFRPAFSNYILGQNALLSVLAFCAAYALAQKERWLPGGTLLALSLLKPSFMLLPALLLLVLHREWKLWLWFLLVTFALNLPSFFLIGWWVSDFLREIGGYAAENLVAWSSGDVFSAAGILWLILSLLLMVIGALRPDKFLVLASGMAFNAVFTPHTADYDLVAFIPLLAYAGYLWLSNQKQNPLWTVSFFGLLWFPWLSLIHFLLIQHQTVEAWYRFIWLMYPNLILISVFLIRSPLIKSIFGLNKERMNSYQIS